MKKSLVIVGLIISNLSFAQLAIGKNSLDQGVILDFGETSTRAIILPKVDISLSSTFTNGTILMDKTEKKIKVRVNGSWLSLSDEGSFDEQLDPNTSDPITTATVLSVGDEVDKGVLIGTIPTNPLDEPQGVLVLESSTQAMILPKVENPHLNIKSPVAGTVCYDTVSDSLAVFDGKVWNYWK